MESLNLVSRQFWNEDLNIDLTLYRDDNDEYWFIAKDVADMFGYKNTKHAIQRHVDDEDIRTIVNLIKGGPETGPPLDGVKNVQPHTKLINESGFYSLALRSKLESAKKFKRWVTRDVLPSIRKQGFYTLPGVLEAIKAIEIPDIEELHGKERREFRKESKSRSDLTKDPCRIEIGRMGGNKAYENKLKKFKSYEDKIERLEAENTMLNAEIERVWEKYDSMTNGIQDLLDEFQDLMDRTPGY